MRKRGLADTIVSCYGALRAKLHATEHGIACGSGHIVGYAPGPAVFSGIQACLASLLSRIATRQDLIDSIDFVGTVAAEIETVVDKVTAEDDDPAPAILALSLAGLKPKEL